MLTRSTIRRLIRENAAEIKSYGVRRIGVFGSFSRSAQGRKSDIDVLVEFKEGEKAFDNYMGLKFFLEKLFNRDVDLVIKGTLKPRIKRRVLGEVSYERL